MNLSFLRTDVDSIIKDITVKIEKLHVVAELKKAEAEAHDYIVAERQKLAAAARTESARALTVAEKLLALVRG